MSFNKKYSSKSNLIDLYKQGGIEEIKKVYSRADAILFRDEFSSQIHELVQNGFDNKVIELLEEEINIRT